MEQDIKHHFCTSILEGGGGGQIFQLEVDFAPINLKRKQRGPSASHTEDGFLEIQPVHPPVAESRQATARVVGQQQRHPYQRTQQHWKLNTVHQNADNQRHKDQPERRNHNLRRGFQSLARFLSDPIDMGIIDAAADGLANITKRSSESLGRLQNGFVRSYALSVLLGVVTILGYLLFK